MKLEILIINMELQKKADDRWTNSEVQALLNIACEDEIQQELETEAPKRLDK